jgi:hypothetical protein
MQNRDAGDGLPLMLFEPNPEAESVIEFRDSPLCHHHYNYKYVQTFVAGDVNYQLGDFVVMREDRRRIWRIDRLEYRPLNAEERAADPNPFPPLNMVCSGFTLSRHFAQIHEHASPPYLEFDEVVEVEDNLEVLFHVDDLGGKVIVVYNQADATRDNYLCRFKWEKDSDYFTPAVKKEYEWTHPDVAEGRCVRCVKCCGVECWYCVCSHNIRFMTECRALLPRETLCLVGVQLGLVPVKDIEKEIIEGCVPNILEY